MTTEKMLDILFDCYMNGKKDTIENRDKAIEYACKEMQIPLDDK